MAGSSIFRIPVPKSFFYLMSLRTGTELITLSLLINKISGLYGILALLTGFHLSPPQLSMYIYSILALFLVAYLAPKIRSPSQPLHVIALAWFYLVDSLVNAGYTTAFGVTWFLVLARHTNPLSDADSASQFPGGKTISDTAGFTNPEHNVSSVEVTVGPSSGTFSGEEAALVGQAHDAATATAQASGAGVFSDAIFQSGSIASITVICFLWLIRFYFVFIMFAYARGVLRQHIVSSSHSAEAVAAGASKEGLADNPFATHMPEGKGWKGKLGRAMVAIPRSFWLGADEEGEWMRTVGGRFGRSKRLEEARPFERERRRRAGTGPPQPSIDLSGVELQGVRK